MAINYAEKYSPQVDERFKLGSLTTALVNNAYDWLGVATVKVYSVPTAEMNDYTLTGSNRYGTPAELNNEVQEMTLAKDRSFTFTIDKKSEDDTMGVMAAGAALARQIDEVAIPEIDTYRISKLVAGAPTANVIKDIAVTKSNAYEKFLSVQEILDNKKIPTGGRICMCTPGYYNMLKLDEAFTKKGDMATKIAINGLVGEVDGVYIIKAPKSYFPENVNFLISNPIVMPAPIKLTEYKIHDDAPGISGHLVEGRIRYDAFVLDQKKDAIGVCQNPAG
ncbi:N4-gp56 family major capsid protein [Dorea sp. Marseille-P4042]|uniref:N4-gp56 family major capsid protein n=1 Tax=Dorea sp. Marseille-P4042 TaxID=2080749 RepID=UPI000CF9C120|nr:N4-gp56 family major capsid protein [Dorea sp. Marseille-P4042]